MVFAFSQTLFTADERELRWSGNLGEVVAIATLPGLNFKIPFIQTVSAQQSKILTLDSPESERFNTKETSWCRWIPSSVADCRRPRVLIVRGRWRRKAGRTPHRADRYPLLREEFGRRTLQEVVSGDRDKIMAIVRDAAEIDAKKIGVRVVDVRLKRVDFDASRFHPCV